MAKRSEYNENYVHSCDREKVEIVVYKNNLSDSASTVYKAEQFKTIIDYYVSKAPILKNDAKDDGFGLRSLAKIGWKGSGALGRLERELIKVANLTLVFIRSDAIV